MRSDYIIMGDTDFVRLMALNPEPQLRAELEGAVVMPTGAVPPGVVTLNARVRYVDESTGESRNIEVVYPTDADAAAGKVSVLAPVGSALIGLSVGERIDWTFPNGRRIRLRVEAVHHPA
ncbi:MAG: transcription elongation factor GreAB [Proteobacteria bacterium]|nr:MAG: transcription elongation factor GreAB [Pseudomonadota bacterium]